MDESAFELDRMDPLGEYPGQFFNQQPELCYLDGNSLGRLPLKSLEVVNGFLREEWGTELVGGWEKWLEQALEVGDLIGRAALGAAAGQTVVTDSTTVNLYQLARAAIAARPGRNKVIVDAANFPTDRYVLQGIADELKLELVVLPNESNPDFPNEQIAPAVLEQYLSDDVALVLLQVINYRSGARQDIKAINQLVRKYGGLCLWDAAHAVGSITLNFDDNEIDLAVGCTYKYGNSGPGAPAWMYVRESLQTELRLPIQGWFAQANQFEMGSDFVPAAGMRGFMVGTPNILSLQLVRTAFEMIEAAGMDEIAAKSARGTDFMVQFFDKHLVRHGFELHTPRTALDRGAHISLAHPTAKQIAYALRVQKQVIPDFRAPNIIRLAISPLTNTYTEIATGLQRLDELMQTGDYLKVAEPTAKVT